MMCVMRVLDEYEPKEVTKSMIFAKCIRWVLEEFPDVMPDELPEDLPPRKRVDRAIEMMPGVEPPAKAPYRMNHEELKVKGSTQRTPHQRLQVSHHMGHPSFLFTRRMGL